MATRSLEAYLAKLQARIAACESKLGIEGAAAGGGDSDEEDAGPTPQQIAFDELISAKVDPFVATAASIGGEAAKLGELVKRGIAQNRRFIELAGKYKKPAMPKLQELFADTTAIVKEAGAMNNRDSPFANHIKAVSEGLPALQWVLIAPMPMEIVTSYSEACDFYANKVRVEFKSKDPNQVKFINEYKAILVALAAYVKANYKTGLEWNFRGKDVPGSATASGGGAASAPPAPKPAAATASGGAGGGAPGGGGMSALFGQIKSIDQSKGKTEGLRHVTKDMKSKGAPSKVSAAATKAPSRRSGIPNEPKGTPSVKLVQKRWVVENYGQGAPVTLEEGVTRDTEVYISGCVGATILINSKAKAMTLDQCYNTQVVFQSMLSSCEIVNCKKVKVQTKGTCKAFAIDKTDGVVVYLSNDSRDALIVTSKSSEMNVSFPDGPSDDAEWIELPIPEQFQSRVGDDNKVHSEVSELYG